MSRTTTFVCGTLFVLALTANAQQLAQSDSEACAEVVKAGPRAVAKEPKERFLGKVREATAQCRGGERAVALRPFPWTDWQAYWGTGDESSLSPHWFADLPVVGANGRGVTGALLDLEYQRIELIKFNLFDNGGAYADYVGTPNGPAQRRWKAMKLDAGDPSYAAVGGAAEWQQCGGELIRHRNLSGICNDLDNPAIGAVGMPFARNVAFEATYPDLRKNELARNRHGDRLAAGPDPQVVSRLLFTRSFRDDANCAADYSQLSYPDDALPVTTNCDYVKAPFFNVLAAFWIQFMTHDWFSHLDEGQNDTAQMMKMGCQDLTPEQAAKLGCRPGDVIDTSLLKDRDDPAAFQVGDRRYLPRAFRTARNLNTAWWDASQIYGYNDRSRARVKRDTADKAKLQMIAAGNRPGGGERQGYLPVFAKDDPILPQWSGQEATAFPDNWSIGMSFYTNVFAREHNLFVDEFRRRAAGDPEGDSGLRNPAAPETKIANKDVSDDELFEAARLVVAAEIAKIHTIEWTPQLLYDEPLYKAMNANWSGLFAESKLLKHVVNEIVVGELGKSQDPRYANGFYSVFASGAGIVGLGAVKTSGHLWWKKDAWTMADANAGVNHFGSPFNFPEEFVTVYRLHPLVPDLLEYRQWSNANAIESKIPVAATVRGKATAAMDNRGLANWALTLGRQRLGALTLGNHPRFLQNLTMPRLGPDSRVDVLALDLVRDREHGVPRFNEFRRQYGLRQLTKYDDFIDPAATGDALATQRAYVAKLRDIYGTHRCDASKPITDAQLNVDGTPINDCHGAPDGSTVDNIEDVDTVVGWLAESRRPHGFAISETQFQVFILNASRRLFSDRFFTSSFRPEFYTRL
ncbi:MAG: oxygenase, partial [Acidobacteria bacterium]|nr:oxygenase [Acidobacteriota bacterium]